MHTQYIQYSGTTLSFRHRQQQISEYFTIVPNCYELIDNGLFLVVIVNDASDDQCLSASCSNPIEKLRCIG